MIPRTKVVCSISSSNDSPLSSTSCILKKFQNSQHHSIVIDIGIRVSAVKKPGRKTKMQGCCLENPSSTYPNSNRQGDHRTQKLRAKAIPLKNDALFFSHIRKAATDRCLRGSTSECGNRPHEFSFPGENRSKVYG